MSNATSSSFLFTVCQVGTEKRVKTEVLSQWPEFRFAFSRPGFVTFRLPAERDLAKPVELRSPFVRTSGLSLGKLSGTSTQELVPQVWQMAAGFPCEALHVWERDRTVPGQDGFEPGPTALAEAVGSELLVGRPSDLPQLALNRAVRSGCRVLDCILVEPHEWWVGVNRASAVPQCWPGGVLPQAPRACISRAYWKMEEALAWSQLPVEAGDLAVEIGCAPGGAVQAMLERGLQVIGIDPAEVAPELLENANFRHIRRRASETPRKIYRGVKWLVVDANVAPGFTLDVVSDIVQRDDTHIRGMLLTLKLAHWELADQIPIILRQVRAWGFKHARVRQLAFNRQEVCLCAMKSRAMRRSLRRKPAPTTETEGPEGQEVTENSPPDGEA